MRMRTADRKALRTRTAADWTTRDGAELYGVDHWGMGYFSVAPNGHLAMQPKGAEGPSVDMLELVREIRRRGLHSPLLIRFSDILSSCVHRLAQNFEDAFTEYAYSGKYRPIYPIKVNQQRQLVEELVEIGRPIHLGLEVGSKAELMVALGLLDTQDALIVCNGYKDRAYFEMALLAQRLGRHCIVVLDRPTELETLLKTSRELGIRPRIGVRARLAARGEGKWVESSGDRSKFGLRASDIVETVRRLQSEDMIECLEMLHFHSGSQITAIRAHKEALREAARIYVGLHELGARPRLIDVGGGLGVDYDGSKTNFHSSMNYTSQEYAMDVVAAIAEACNERKVPHPDIVTECGRAMVSAGSVLVFDVLDSERVHNGQPPVEPIAGDHRIVKELYEIATNVSDGNELESFHDASQLKEEATSLFALGYIDLPVRARIDELFWTCCERILERVDTMEYVPEDLQNLEHTLSDTYYGNFSVFQSLPDSWALDQLFPMMPIHRLDERPTRRATFADLTCDSDGKVDQFIDLRDVRRVLDLHVPNGEPYYIGVFLVGAYQETLGEVHNLFGDTDTVHVRIEDSGRYTIDHVVEGDSMEEVLSYVRYDRRGLTERVRRAIEEALRRGDITLEEGALLRRRYDQGLSGYTYLDHEP
jgi:arginine decarboxylase